MTLSFSLSALYAKLFALRRDKKDFLIKFDIYRLDIAKIGRKKRVLCKLYVHKFMGKQIFAITR